MMSKVSRDTSYRVGLFLPVLLACFCFVRCTGDPDEVLLQLNLDSVGAPENIYSYFFVVESAQGQRKIFPKECGDAANGCRVKTTSCIESFKADQAEFDVKLDFSTFSEGAAVQVTACAMDSTHDNVVAAGEALDVLNQASATTTEIVLDDQPVNQALCQPAAISVCE